MKGIQEKARVTCEQKQILETKTRQLEEKVLEVDKELLSTKGKLDIARQRSKSLTPLLTCLLWLQSENMREL